MQAMTTLLKGAALAAGLAYAGFAQAQEAPSSPAQTADAVEVLSLEDLGELRGGDGGNATIITEQTLNAVNSGNSVVGDIVGSGQVSLGSGAFSGYAGLGNFVINTGHNNNLQASMNVSVALTPETP
jgi:hypothetical protein